jgi:hypothetical protein
VELEPAVPRSNVGKDGFEARETTSWLSWRRSNLSHQSDMGRWRWWLGKSGRRALGSCYDGEWKLIPQSYIYIEREKERGGIFILSTCSSTVGPTHRPLP